MNMPARCILMSLTIIFLSACGSTQYTLKPGGDTADITTRKQIVLKGELLSLQDNSAYIVSNDKIPKVVRVAFSDIRSIEIEGYANRKWVGPWVVFQVIPTALFTIAAGSAGASIAVAFAMFAFPTVTTFAFLDSGTPPTPHCDSPVMEDIFTLRKYARFQQALDRDQLQKVLVQYGQLEPQQEQ